MKRTRQMDAAQLGKEFSEPLQHLVALCEATMHTLSVAPLVVKKTDCDRFIYKWQCVGGFVEGGFQV